MIDVINCNLDYVLDSGVDILTYKYSEQINKLVQNYIAEEIDGLVLKFYVPKERLMSKEISKMTELFEEYINATLQSKVVVNKMKTADGILIEFFADRGSKTEVLNAWNSFPQIMDIFVSDYEKTRELIWASGIPEAKKDNLLHILVSESKRILVDLKYEMGRKQLELNYLMENKIIEVDSFDALGNSSFSGFGNVMKDNIMTLPIAHVENMNYTYINNIEGNIIKNENDEQLIELIRNYALETAKAELINSVNELNDESISGDKKITALSKVKGFLIKNGDKIGDIGFKLLMKYIESKL